MAGRLKIVNKRCLNLYFLASSVIVQEEERGAPLAKQSNVLQPMIGSDFSLYSNTLQKVNIASG